MSDGLKAMASDKVKQILGKSSDNIFIGVLTGTIVTAVLDSSSAVIIMIIAMVNAGIMTSKQSYGIIVGSNIGTTLSSQLIAFDIGEFAAVPLVIGLIFIMAGKNQKYRDIGKSILGFGLIFFGLYYIGHSVEPLKKLAAFEALMSKIENPFKGATVGAIATVIIQSSSATIGIVISFANQGLITLAASVGVMLGAEIGTCTDTLFATIGRSRAALRAGVFHLFFSIVTAVIALILIQPFIALVNLVSGDSSLARHIANSHVLFNILAAALFIGFVPLIARTLIKLIPNKGKSKNVAVE
ncbi:MAG: Na/Pi cotransporter family protein [Bacteroidia bacterium]|nr:Na/Pi cotransporter family protein [Bacteroidia bacterium]